MKTTVFTGPRQVDIRDVAVPQTQPSQVLVKTHAVGLCTLEQRFYQGATPDSYPFLGGHEVAGEVVAVGTSARTTARVGDIVSLALLTRCGTCYYCRRGMDNLCVHNNESKVPGQLPGPAGLSEYVVAEDYQVYPTSLPPAHDEEWACRVCELALAEPLACVVRSVQVPPLRFGDLALVQGAGIMGLLHIQLLKQHGVRIVMAEPDAQRRQLALQAGADWAVDPLHTDLAAFLRERSDGYGVNAAFFTAGGASAIQQALEGMAKGAWLCLYGSVHPKGPIQIDPNLIHYNEWVVTGSFSHTSASFQQAVALIASRKVDLQPYVSERVAFPDVQRGLERAISPDTYRVVMVFV
ncbi:MAG: alcohol dehydrogenase catalytic domain-containing protein [Chloroflexi bacterium]|nr:alcohol dehydrogenase catalytic domain-containing protein [Chloroflexota bacterium]